MSLALSDTIHRLQAYTDSPSPILSVYLDATLKRPDLLKRFDHLLKQSLKDRDLVILENNIMYTRSFLQTYKHHKKDQGLALFSGGDNLFEVVTTQFSLPSLVAVDHSPYLHPLYDQIEDYERYLVIVADREKAKIFTLLDTELEEQSQLFEEKVPQKVKGRNFEERQDKIERHIQDHLHRHFLHVAEEVKRFIAHRPVTGVIVGGHKPIFSELLKTLPTHLHAAVIGEFAAEPDDDFNDLLHHAQEIVISMNDQSRHDVPTVIRV